MNTTTLHGAMAQSGTKTTLSLTFKTKNCSLHQGDAYELIKHMPDNSVDVILTDPPYNLRRGIDGPNRDKVPFHPGELVEDFKRILKPKGNLFAFTSFQQMGKWHEHFDEVFDRMQFMVWHKTNPGKNEYKTSFVSSCELIMCMWNKGHCWNFSSQQDMHNFFESGKCRGDERLKKRNGRSLHPTQKPVDLLTHLIRISSKEGDIIFDPFMGVGSTGVAALAHGRKFIGFEKEAIYFSHAKKRIVEGGD